MIRKIKASIRRYRINRRWRTLRGLGMEIGNNVNLPLSTWIDISHCYTISIGDNCGFGDGCVLVAHDAMANEFLDATLIAGIRIHESCHFGSRVVILPGVEIGPRSIVGAGAVVTHDIPPESVAAGNPARIICTLEEYLDKHRERMKEAPTFPFDVYGYYSATAENKDEIRRSLVEDVGYIVGGWTSDSKWEGAPRTK